MHSVCAPAPILTFCEYGCLHSLDYLPGDHSIFDIHGDWIANQDEGSGVEVARYRAPPKVVGVSRIASDGSDRNIQQFTAQ